MNDFPAPVAARFQAAIAAYRNGAIADAARGFAAVLEAAPDHPDALRLHGLCLVRAGNAAGGLPALARARRISWDDPLAHLHFGIGLQEAGRHARAAAVLRRAAALAPGNPAVWINFAAPLIALGHAPAARAAARRAIALVPDAPEPHYTLGLAELAAGDPRAAFAAFRAAIERRADFAPAWLNLALAAYRAGEVGTATAAMRRALAVDPGNAAAAANLAAFLLLGGDTEEALTLLRAALARDPASVPARLNLANTLLLDREPAEALAILQGPAPPGREGKHWRAHRALALLQTGEPDAARAELDAIAPPYGDAEILILWRRIALAPPDAVEDLAARMAVLLDDDSFLPEHRIIGHFELARFRHARGDPARAFAHWTAGHRLLARFQPYDRATVRAFTDASIAAFDAARLAGARAGNADPRPVFVVGMPRSGTTLTEQILAAHRDVHGAGERPALHRLIRDLAGSAETADGARALAALDAAALDRAAAAYVAELAAEAPGAARIIDKMPSNARHLGFLALLLPGARFIHCRRDPRDIGLSIFQLRFFGYHPYAHDLADLGFAIAAHERLMDHWRAILGERLLEVALTDWVEDFRGTLARVLTFLGLEYDPACERFHERTDRVRTASAEQVRQPVNARGIGRYRDYAAYLEPLFVELRAAGLTDFVAGPAPPG